MSGISIPDEILSLFEAVKIKKAHKSIVFTLEKTGEVGGKATFGFKILDKTAPDASPDSNQAAFEALVKSLPADAARFIVFDFLKTTSDGRLIQKLILIKWCPDSVHFKVKPVIGATYTTLKEKLAGIAKDFQAVDASDLDYAAVSAAL